MGIQRVFTDEVNVGLSCSHMHLFQDIENSPLITAKVILYLCGGCDVYECSVPHSIFICVSDRLVWLSMISKVYRNRLFLSDKLCW